MNKLALLLLLVLLGQGVIAGGWRDMFGGKSKKIQDEKAPKRDTSKSANPNSAECKIGWNPFDQKTFLHRNAGFLYSGVNPRLKDELVVKNKKDPQNVSTVKANNEKRKKVRAMNFKNFHQPGANQDQTIYPEGEFLSFNWAGLADDPLFNEYTANRIEYTPKPAKKSAGDYMPPGDYRNYIWFGKQNNLHGRKGFFREPVPTDFPILYNAMDHTVWDDRSMGFKCVDRRSFGGPYQISRNRLPLNPKGPSGVDLKQRNLYRYGVNHAADPIVMRRSGEGEYEIVLVKRKDEDYVAIPGGFVDPGHTFGRTLTKELGEEAVQAAGGLDRYMERNYDALLLYKGYSDDNRNSDRAWVETTAAMYLDTTPNNAASAPHTLQLHDDTEGHTVGTFWLKMKKDRRGNWVPKWPKKLKKKGRKLFASHKFLIKEACEYADKCFKYEGETMVPKNDDPQCTERRARYTRDMAAAQEETDDCQAKSTAFSCCLWISNCDDRYVTHQDQAFIEGAFNNLNRAFVTGGDRGEMLRQQHLNEWEKKCTAPAREGEDLQEAADMGGDMGGGATTVAMHLPPLPPLPPPPLPPLPALPA